jgi:anion-transporting  ArsA/GET3 family ATPase
MSDDLKPCPFCGGKASKIPDDNHSTGWEVGCFSGKCDVEPHVWAVHLETAIMQWNTCADKDRIEELEKAFRGLKDVAIVNLKERLEAEAKLAKAMEALREIADFSEADPVKYIQGVDAIALDALAELEGKE